MKQNATDVRDDPLNLWEVAIGIVAFFLYVGGDILLKSVQ